MTDDSVLTVYIICAAWLCHGVAIVCRRLHFASHASGMQSGHCIVESYDYFDVLKKTITGEHKK